MKKTPYILLILLLLVGLSSANKMASQMPDTRSVVKSLYIYTFATLVEWPENKRSGDFTIGVFGEQTAVYKDLTDKYKGKFIGSQKINVINYRNINDIKECHILYITKPNSQFTSTLSKTWSKKSTLLVAEKTGSLDKGAVVNFIVEGNQQKYEINRTNAKNHNLVLAEKLSSLAARVVK